jgi:hypothetical protein
MHQATPRAPVITAFHLSSTCNWCRHTCNQPVRRRVRRDDHLVDDGFHRRLRPRLPPTRPDHSTSPLRPRLRSLGHIGDARGRRPYRIRLHGVHEQSSAAPNRPPRRRRRRGVRAAARDTCDPRGVLTLEGPSITVAPALLFAWISRHGTDPPTPRRDQPEQPGALPSDSSPGGRGRDRSSDFAEFRAHRIPLCIDLQPLPTREAPHLQVKDCCCLDLA